MPKQHERWLKGTACYQEHAKQACWHAQQLAEGVDSYTKFWNVTSHCSQLMLGGTVLDVLGRRTMLRSVTLS